MHQYNYSRAAEEHQEAIEIAADSWISKRVEELLPVITDETAKNFFVLQFSGRNLHLIGCDAFDTIRDDLNEVIYDYCLAMSTAERRQIEEEDWLYS